MANVYYEIDRLKAENKELRRIIEEKNEKLVALQNTVDKINAWEEEHERQQGIIKL